MTKRRIQPKAAVEVETVSLRLAPPFVRAVDQYAKYLGGSTDRTHVITDRTHVITDRTHVITQAMEIALAQDKDFQKALSARPRPRHRVVAVATYLQNNVTASGAQPVPSASSHITAVFTAALSDSLGGQLTFPRQ